MVLIMSKNNDGCEDCPEATTNPNCPYLSKINQMVIDVEIIKRSLLGVDYKGGLVGRVQKLETTNKVLIFLGGALTITLVGLAFKFFIGA